MIKCFKRLLCLVFVGLLLCGTTGYAKESSYVDKIYEKDGKPYLNITIEEAVGGKNEELSLADFQEKQGTQELFAYAKGTDLAFIKDTRNILAYQDTLAECDELYTLDGKTLVEKEVIKQKQRDGARKVLKAQERYGAEVCSVPTNLTIKVETVDCSTSLIVVDILTGLFIGLLMLYLLREGTRRP